MPARTRTIAALSIPSRIAIASAVLKPMPRRSRTKRYWFSDLTWSASAPWVLKMRTARAVPPMTVQKDHDLAYDLLLGPGVCDALGAHRPDAGYSHRRVGSASIS